MRPARPARRAGPPRAGRAFARCAALFLLLLTAAGCVQRAVPPGPGSTPPRLAVPPSADAAGVLVAADGYRLPLRAWRPASGAPRAVILALHGFNDYSRAFAAPGAALAARGIAVYAYDQRGFGATAHPGLWAGRQALVDDLRTAARLVARRHPGVPLYLLGESMGGAVVLAAAGGARPPRADGLILAAPAVWARDAQPWYQRAALWLAVRLVPGLRPSGRELDIQASDNIAMLRALGRDPLVLKDARVDALAGLVDLMDAALAAAPRIALPTLLLYGEKDEIIPRAAIDRFRAALPARPGSRFVVYPEGWHLLLRDLQAERVIADIAAWIADPRAPLSSVAAGQACAGDPAGACAPR